MARDGNSTDRSGHVFDVIIIGAGPGGLQAAIYLGRYNRKVLLIDRGGGRTAHARSIENFLSHKAIPGKRLIELGMEQARSFNVRIEKGLVSSVRKKELYEVSAGDVTYCSRFVIVSTGIYENIPAIENVHRFFGTSFFTCIDCDGYKTRDKKLVVLGNTIETVRLALAMQQIYTRDVTVILADYDPPPDYLEELRERGIPMKKGRPVKIVGEDHMEAVELTDGTRVACEVVMAGFGFKLNDTFLNGLDLKRSLNASFIVNRVYESSLNGLYIVGPLNTGNDQAVIAAGEGAVAAIDINKRMFEF
jgi:thioredoxin reductase (NADPH)